MANNSNRRAIEFMVQGTLPPHSTNVLWMDTSVPELPVLKIFENGAWTTVHTEDSKSIKLLSETILAQQIEIAQLTNDIEAKIDGLQLTVAKESTTQEILDGIDGVAQESTSQSILDAVENIDFSALAKDETVAKEAQATLNKNELKQEMRNVAGPCIIEDYEEEGLPFEAVNGFCAILGDNDFVFGDFLPYGVHADDYAVGTVIKVTGDNATQEEFDYYEEGSKMAVAETVDTPSTVAHEETGLYRDSEGHMHGILSYIEWKKGGVYRVTGIVECYSEYDQGMISVITYEEVTNTVTDLVKQAADKVNDTAIGVLNDQTNGLAAIKSEAAAAKQAAQGITGYALQGSGNATQTDIASLIGYTISEIDGV